MEIDQAFKDDGKAIVTIDQHNVYSVYVGKSGPNLNSWDNGRLPSKEDLSKTLNIEPLWRQMNVQGYYGDITYGLRELPIGEETVFETDFH